MQSLSEDIKLIDSQIQEYLKSGHHNFEALARLLEVKTYMVSIQHEMTECEKMSLEDL